MMWRSRPAPVCREGGEQFREDGLRQAGCEIPHRLAAGGLDEGDDVQPPVPMMAESDQPLADGRPDPAPDRLQAEAVPVLGPDLDRAAGMRRPGFRGRLLQPPSKSACSAEAAAPPCRG